MNLNKGYGMHLVLLGDSVFDNRVYVASEESVAAHLKRLLPADINLTCLAVDGHLTSDVFCQLDRLPETATHIALSSGGNDALSLVHLLDSPCCTISDALKQLSQLLKKFEHDYGRLKNRLELLGLPVLVCTIYDAVPGLPSHWKTALSLFNDVISKGIHNDLNDCLDLRTCLHQESDFSEKSPIEPSGTGGLKIAQHITGWIGSYRH